MITITSLKNNTYINNRNSCCRFNFKGDLQDIFEKSPQMKFYDHYEDQYIYSPTPKDLTKPQKIVLSGEKPIILDYNPNRFDYLRDKKTGKQIKTMILKSDDDFNKTSYHFFSEKLDKQYGYVILIKYEQPQNEIYIFSELLEHRPKEGIEGGRVIVEYLKNLDNKNIGGIGKLSDKLSVKYCIDNNLPFNIVSVADKGSHIAHYLRGKRFFTIDQSEDPYKCKYLQDTFGSTDVNKILEELIKNEDYRSGNIKPQLGFIGMYLPKELAMNYAEELKKHPII